MSPAIIGALLGGGLGLLKGDENVKKNIANENFRRAAIMYSPWTHMGDPGQVTLPGGLESGLQGAATGGMVGAMASPAAGATTASAPLEASGKYVSMSAMNPEAPPVFMGPEQPAGSFGTQGSILGRWFGQRQS